MTAHFCTRTLALVAVGCAIAQAQPQVATEERTLSWRQALRQSPEWHASPEALRIAEQVLLYQLENGGWSKNIDMALPLTDEQRRHVERLKSDLRQSTIDNDATFEQMDFLARVYRATGRDRYREGVERGLDFLIGAQYAHGGWPQYPARDRGYHIQITYNDGAMARVLNRLLDIIEEREPYDFFDDERRQAARVALARGIQCVLDTQIRVEGRLTAWCAQHDKDTLKPAQGRSYEHPSISGAESAGVVRFLMRLQNPSPEIIQAIQSAVAWFEASKLRGIRLQTVSGPEYEHGRDRVVVEDPDAPPLWARFYEIETNRPIFSGRDGIIKYDLADIEHERRNGYSWLGGYATALLERDYPQWQQHWAPASGRRPAADTYAERVANVLTTPGCVALWDFVKREPDGERRFTAHVPPGTTNDFALDAANYIRDYWSEGPEATYDDFPLLGRGPFGNAIRIRREADPHFRPFLFVPRSRLHDSSLDIKGAGRSVSVVVWAIRESGNHALAGIWHEGTDLKQESTATIRRVERGQRQYALFAGLNVAGSACGHVSENGASSFLNRYALHKCNSAGVSAAVPADSTPEVLDASWQCFAMTFDHERQELTGWLNGVAGDRWLDDPKNDRLISSAYNAYMQAHWHHLPGRQPGEDPGFPPDQFYNPPEDHPVSVEILSATAEERVELREYRYTKIHVVFQKGADGQFAESSRDLVALRLNPWWFPHEIYTPPNDDSGGPFSIGRVIHSSRSVGFTGWIGGVAVFNRALTADELARFSWKRPLSHDQ